MSAQSDTEQYVYGLEAGRILRKIHSIPAPETQEDKSKKTSRYLAAIELLARYESGKDKLSFAYEWLKANQQADKTWDMGAAAKDGVYFPLSDRWDKTTRIIDSTHRIGKLFSLPYKTDYGAAAGP